MRPVAFALVVVVLSGCGSGSPPRAGKVSEREWASGASQILAGLDEALAKVGVAPPPAADPATADELRAFLTGLAG